MKSIRMRLTLSFLAIIVLCSGLAIFNYFSLSMMNQKTKDMLSNDWPTLIAGKELSYNIAHRVSLLNSLMLYRDNNYRRDYTDYYLQSEDIKEQLLKSDQSAEVLELLEMTEEWHKVIQEEVFVAYDKGLRDEAARILETKSQPVAVNLIGRYQDLAKKQEDNAIKNGNSVVTFGENIQLNGIIVSIAIVLIGLAIATYTSGVITKPIRQIVNRMNIIAKGELPAEPLKTKLKDEIGQLITAVNTMNENVRNMIVDIGHVSEDVTSQGEELTQYADEVKTGSQQIAATMEELSKGAEEQANSSASLNEKMNSFAQEIMQVVVEGEGVKEKAGSMVHLTNEGSHAMDESIQKMAVINESMRKSNSMVKGLDSKTNEITQLVNVIREIADQTNLLALNAAIEAARAGEQRKGFAVVADEVRKLAEQVSNSVSDITSIVTDIQNESKQVVESLDNGYELVQEGTSQISSTGSTFMKIQGSISEVENNIESMAASLYGILDQTQSINSSIENIASVSEESAAGLEQVSATSQQSSSAMEEVSNSARLLEENATRLNELVQQFKVRD
ncbi:methyl-accepting chemotaxis protein [Robertmurraya sp. DFI.2.37]|nr:methyl-accepting chemotaxis protein [Robertmurraya sp. DFI.2.37]